MHVSLQKFIEALTFGVQSFVLEIFPPYPFVLFLKLGLFSPTHLLKPIINLRVCINLSLNSLNDFLNLVTNARLIIYFGIFIFFFRHFSCMIFCTMFSVCKARQVR